jgi:hypothetical protein
LLTDGCDAHYRWNFLFRVLMRMWPITSVKISGTRAKSDFARVFFCCRAVAAGQAFGRFEIQGFHGLLCNAALAG